VSTLQPISILEDEFSNETFSSTTVVVEVSAGGSGEEDIQQMSFFLSHIELDPFSVARGMTLFREHPRVQWLNGTAALVSFRTVPFQFGIATIYFHLQVSAHVMLNLVWCGLRTCSHSCNSFPPSRLSSPSSHFHHAPRKIQGLSALQTAVPHPSSLYLVA